MHLRSQEIHVPQDVYKRQIVYHDSMENFAEISKLNVGAAIIVKGTLVATPQAKQPFEIQAEEIIVEGASAPDYPLQKKRHSLEYLRTSTHFLRLYRYVILTSLHSARRRLTTRLRCV